MSAQEKEEAGSNGQQKNRQRRKRGNNSSFFFGRSSFSVGRFFFYVGIRADGIRFPVSDFYQTQKDHDGNIESTLETSTHISISRRGNRHLPATGIKNHSAFNKRRV